MNLILVCASHALPLPQILFKNRFKNDNGSNCLLSIDGADFKIPNHGRKYYSHKFKGSGLRYEVGLSIQKGDICWIFGPFKCGQFNDLMIFRMGLKKELGRGEKVIADGIYGAEAPLKVRAPGTIFSKPQNQAMEKRVRARHEHCNRRMKQWAILRQEFRHDLTHHESVFCAIAVMTQLCIQNGEPLATVSYKE